MVAELVDIETRKLASFRIVDSIEPIEGADAIELAVVGGWKVVTKKGEFKPGDPCVYFEIDSFMPDGVPAWQFLVDKSSRIFNGVKGHKLRTIKLRGQISQGLILPTNAHPAAKAVLALDDESFAVVAEELTPEQLEEAKHLRFGMDEHMLDPRDLNLNKLLGIVKWEPVMNAQLAGMAEGLFPSFIPKTDEERAQNLKSEIFGFDDEVSEVHDVVNLPEEAFTSGRFRCIDGKVFKVSPGKADRDAKYEVTLKCDGSSMTAFARVVEGVVESGVCSRNLQLKVNDANAENSFVKVAVESGLLAALEKLAQGGEDLAVQGELMGPGIQGNREELTSHEFYVFNIIDIRTRAKLEPRLRREVFDRIVAMGVKIKHAPIVAYEANLLDTLGIQNMDQLLKFAEGPSIKHPIREGLVFKRLDGLFSWKVISNKYLEKEKD